MSRIIIVVPTYNEAENIAHLISAIANSLPEADYKVLVVDDNSPDDTASIAESSGRGRVNVCRRTGRHGIGSALREGLSLALADKDCQWVVSMDADFSHRPEDLWSLIEACETADIVQGSRYVHGGRIVGWGLSRRIMSWLANMMCRILGGSSLHENTTNFRAYSRRAAEIVTQMCSAPGYEWVVEAVLVAQRFGFTLVEVPITFADRVAGYSKLGWIDLLRWWRFLWQIFFVRTSSSGFLVYLPWFLGIGSLCAFVNLATLWLLKQVNVPLLLAGALAIEISLIANFLGNHIWTFRNRRKFSQTPLLLRLWGHQAVYTVGMLLNLALLLGLTLAVRVHYLLANAVGIGVAAAWNLRGSLHWIWPSHSHLRD